MTTSSHESVLTLTDSRLVGPALFELTFTRPDDYDFEAGQFARLGLALDGAEPVFRAYSIASAPEEPVLRFLIKAVDGGVLSPKLTALKPGDTVRLDGPAQGTLLPARIPGGEALWCIATGSGLAPFLSVIGSEAAAEAWPQVYVVIGARTHAETRALRTLAQSRARRPVTILTAVTREADPEESLAGRLPALLAEGALEKALGTTITPDNARVLLCGNPDFTKAMRAELKTRGLVSPRFGKPGQVLVEALW